MRGMRPTHHSPHPAPLSAIREPNRAHHTRTNRFCPAAATGVALGQLDLVVEVAERLLVKASDDLGLDRGELESVLRLVHSHFDVSVRRLLED